MAIFQRHVGLRPGSAARSAAAYSLVLLSPAVAWVAWISWSEYKASDIMSVLWFVTVALGCLVAGGLAEGTAARPVVLTALAIVATLTTLYLWWSSEDVTGLFMVGIVTVTILVVPAVVALVGLGHFLGFLISRSPHTVP